METAAPSPTHRSGYRAPAVHKAFDILRAVVESRHGLGISEIARRLGYSKSSIHGIVHALVHQGALQSANGAKRFYPGPTLVDLAFSSWNYLKLAEQAQPGLEKLRNRISETVFLGVSSRLRAVIMGTAEASKPLKISAPPGTSIPLMAGAVGKVFLSQLATDRALGIIRLQGLPRYTPNSIVNENDYLKELEAVRQKGYALDDGEYLPGVRAVAVGLGNRRGLPMALWVVGLAGDMAGEHLERIVSATRETASRLQSDLDGPV